MGEAANDILDGSCCQFCGEWFHDGDAPGHPRGCGCQRVERNRRKRKNRQRNKRARLESADLAGWNKLSEHHFRRKIGDKSVDWWPSTRKYRVDGGETLIGDPNHGL